MQEKYDHVPGDIIFPSDLQHKNLLAYHYVIRGTASNLQATCDAWLNVPWQRKYRFTPSNPYLIVSFINATCYQGNCSVQSLSNGNCNLTTCTRSVLMDHHNRELGSIPYNFVSMSMMLSGKDRNLLLFSPYAFCDDGTVMANYREMLGWNVLFANIAYPLVKLDRNKNNFGFVCAIDVPRLSLTGTNDPEKMIELVAADSSDREIPLAEPSFGSLPEAVIQIQAYLNRQFSKIGETVDSSTTLQIAMALTGSINRVTLRQFRGTTTGDKALLQSIQTFSNAYSTFHGGGLIPEGQRLFFPATSEVAKRHFPLHKDFGLSEESQIIAGIWTLRDSRHNPVDEHWSGIPKK